MTDTEHRTTSDLKEIVVQLSCLTFSIKRNSVKNKPPSSLVVSLGKALDRMPTIE